jgi:hypothetical protein
MESMKGFENKHDMTDLGFKESFWLLPWQGRKASVEVETH